MVALELEQGAPLELEQVAAIINIHHHNRMKRSWENALEESGHEHSTTNDIKIRPTDNILTIHTFSD